MPKPKKQKQAEAEARNAAWRSLTPAQKLARLDQHNLAATRQRARIAKDMERAAKEAEAVVAKPEPQGKPLTKSQKRRVAVQKGE